MQYENTQNPHQTLLEQRLPAWTLQATPEHWKALQQALIPVYGFADEWAPWFANAAPDLREKVVASNARLMHSQRALARSLKGLQQIAEFTEPLLVERLQTAHHLNTSVRTSELIRIRHLFTWQTYVSQHERHSLLEAALQNFADDATFSPDSALALTDDIQIKPIRVVGQTTLGDSETLVDIELDSETYSIKSLPLAPADYAQTCRELDLGRRYQEHLTAMYAPPQVATLAATVYRDQLRLAADLAFMRQRLNGAGLDALQALVDDRTAFNCHQLNLFGLPVHEALIIDSETSGLLLHLPGQANSLRQSRTLSQLHDQLRDDLQDPGFRQRFAAYLPREQQQTFLSRLQQNLDGGDLHLTLQAITEPLFSFLHDDHVRRVRAEARLLAVPTLEADEQARKRRQAHWESVELDALMLAGLFIPEVGVLMLAVTAFQLLDEVFEGYQAWSVGDRHQALQHLEGVGINLALIGGLHVAGTIGSKLSSSTLMESVDPITLADGSQRLWRPDLSTYRSDVDLPASLEANAQGQFSDEGRHFIRLEGQLYEQRLDTDLQRWRIVDADRPEAYQPLLEHNGDGAWRAAHEEPQRWSDLQLLRRLAPNFHTADATLLRQAMKISGVSRARLQAVYLASEATPPLLADTLERLALAERLPEQPGPALERLYQSRAPSSGEQRLCAAYNRLTVPLARRLLGRLQPQELASWANEGTLPAWLGQQASQVNAELVLTRAIEGLYQPRFASVESDRLLLACLERLPLWPNELRLELRNASPDGPLLTTLGDELASTRRVVLKSADGYEAFRGDLPTYGRVQSDPLQAVLEVLPPGERQALALGDDGAKTLRKQVLVEAERGRQSWPRRLWGPDARPMPLKMGLRGGAPLDPLPPPSPYPHLSLARRLRRLYPSISDETIESTLTHWRRTQAFAEREILARELELQGLQENLHNWARGTPRRKAAIARIVRAWQRNSPVFMVDGADAQGLNLSFLDLENEDLQTLLLPNRFGHVDQLLLDGNRALSQLPERFLERLPNLRHLRLANCRFNRMPTVIQPAELRWLDMEGNRITWDDEAQATLSNFSALEILDLSHNPLLRAPDLRPPRLRAVFLSNCSLTELPLGLERIRDPIALELSANQFTHLPEGFGLPRANGQALQLQSSSLSAHIRQQIDRYYDAFGVDLLVNESDYTDMLEGATALQIQQWQQLPLTFRRDLHTLMNSPDFPFELPQAQRRFWHCIDLFNNDPVFRFQVLERPGVALFELPF